MSETRRNFLCVSALTFSVVSLLTILANFVYFVSGIPKWRFRVQVGNHHNAARDTYEQEFAAEEIINHEQYSSRFYGGKRRLKNHYWEG